MKILLVFLLLLPQAAHANCCEPVRPIVRVTTQAPVETQSAASTATSGASGAKANTGNQTINLSFPRKTVVVERKVVRKVRVNYRPNHLVLLGGASKTGIEVYNSGCCSFNADTKREADVGLQYLRSISRLDVSGVATIRGGLYLGVGFNW